MIYGVAHRPECVSGSLLVMPEVDAVDVPRLWQTFGKTTWQPRGGFIALNSVQVEGKESITYICPAIDAFPVATNGILHFGIRIYNTGRVGNRNNNRKPETQSHK